MTLQLFNQPDLGKACHTNYPLVRCGLLGSKTVGAATLLRFYVLHCIAVPLGAGLLIAVHFWRVRKDGGISGPM